MSFFLLLNKVSIIEEIEECVATGNRACFTLHIFRSKTVDGASKIRTYKTIFRLFYYLMRSINERGKHGGMFFLPWKEMEEKILRKCMD